MEYIKKFYLIPWTIWCGLSFFILNLIFFPIIVIFLLSENKTLYKWTHHIPTIIGRLSSFLWGIRVKVSGRDYFNPNTQYIFVGNHRSMLDAIISGGFIYNPKKFIGKAEILKWPFLGYLLRKIYIPVKRDSKESRKWSQEQLIQKMKEGYSMIVFSEGKTNVSTEPLLPFKDGAYITACESKTTIVPFVIIDADKLWPRKYLLIRPGTIQLKFLQPIPPKNSSDENIENLKQETFSAIFDAYTENV